MVSVVWVVPVCICLTPSDDGFAVLFVHVAALDQPLQMLPTTNRPLEIMNGDATLKVRHVEFYLFRRSPPKGHYQTAT